MNISKCNRRGRPLGSRNPRQDAEDIFIRSLCGVFLGIVGGAVFAEVTGVKAIGVLAEGGQGFGMSGRAASILAGTVVGATAGAASALADQSNSQPDLGYREFRLADWQEYFEAEDEVYRAMLE